MDVKPVFLQINTDGAHFLRDGPRRGAPAVEDAPPVGPEGDDVAEGFQGREGLVDCDGVALAAAFYGGGETAEAWGVLVWEGKVGGLVREEEGEGGKGRRGGEYLLLRRLR